MRNPLTRDHLLSLVVAPIIWGIHFLLCYLLVSLACTFGFGGARAGIGILTLIALALLGYAGLANYRKWAQARRMNRRDATSGADIHAFFALNAMMLCGVSAIALIWVAFPAAMLPTCAA